MKCQLCDKRIWFWQKANRFVLIDPNRYKRKQHTGKHITCLCAYSKGQTRSGVNEDDQNVIYEYATESSRCVILTKAYGSSLEKMMWFFQLARSDFPYITLGDVEIKQYGGRRRKGFFGIEFTPKGNVPDKYDKIHRLEFTL